jgi:hypothetical protein
VSDKPDRFGEVIGAVTEAIRLLGGDSALQAAVGGWRDCVGDAETLGYIREWVESERRRINGVIATPLFSLRENAIAKEPGSSYPE